MLLFLSQIVKNIMFDKSHDLIFCYIPKNGCSFWKRVFSILNGFTRNDIFQMSSVKIHKQPNTFSISVQKTLHRLLAEEENLTKVIYVRDPYERLFSGYIDKVFAPCSRYKQKVYKYFNTSKTTYRGISLNTFAQYLVTSDLNNQHFQRQNSMCHVCEMNYTFIGKFETFMDDAVFLMKMFNINITSILGSQITLKERSDMNIIQDVIKRSFQGCRKLHNFSTYHIVSRVWKMFQVKRKTQC